MKLPQWQSGTLHHCSRQCNLICVNIYFHFNILYLDSVFLILRNFCSSVLPIVSVIGALSLYFRHHPTSTVSCFFQTLWLWPRQDPLLFHSRSLRVLKQRRWHVHRVTSKTQPLAQGNSYSHHASTLEVISYVRKLNKCIMNLYGWGGGWSSRPHVS